MKLGGAPPPRKPVVLKKASEVVKSDDLFAELGMNAQVKKTERISTQKKPTLELSDSVSSDAWGDDSDLDL